MYAEEFNKVIKQIAEEKQVQVEELSYGYILKLTKQKQHHYIIGHKFELNSHVAGAISKDKYATYTILKNAKIPVVEHQIIFNPNTREEYVQENSKKEILQYFYQNERKIVIKPNMGHEGKGVYLCQTEEEIEEAIQELFQKNDAIVVCPFYDIDREYRTIYIQGECVITYGKEIPILIGDGIHTVEELISLQGIEIKEGIKEENLKGIDLTKILKIGENFKILWKHNLSGGAIPQPIKDKALERKIQELVRKTAQILNLNFASIDVIQTKSGELYVLETNSGICTSNFREKYPEGEAITKKIYEKAMDYMFQE